MERCKVHIFDNLCDDCVLSRRMIEQVEVRQCLIDDWPRFPHRGILLDTARHYLPEEKIIENLELMAENKFNVLHWHIVDDQSFPFVSETFPEMSAKGAYSPTHVYTPDAVQRILHAARIRGIRVVAEFDTPGHTMSWGPAHKGLLSECYDADGKPLGQQALLDPTKENTYKVLLALFTEVLHVFPDQYVHLGADEVSYQYSCWLNNPEIKKFMERHNYTKGRELENFYVQRLVQLVEKARNNTEYIAWQEVFDNNIDVRNHIEMANFTPRPECGELK